MQKGKSRGIKCASKQLKKSAIQRIKSDFKKYMKKGGKFRENWFQE